MYYSKKFIYRCILKKYINLESIDKEIKNLKKKNIFNKKWKSKDLLKYLFYKNSNSRIKKYLKQTNKF